MTGQVTATLRAISQDVSILNRKGNSMNPEIESRTAECGDRTRLIEQEPRNESPHSIPADKANIAAQPEAGKREDRSDIPPGIMWA
jgi:hypothetical protein